jgi:hypothetical protein
MLCGSCTTKSATVKGKQAKKQAPGYDDVNIRILKVTFVAAGQEIKEKALATTVVGAVFVFGLCVNGRVAHKCR